LFPCKFRSNRHANQSNKFFADNFFRIPNVPFFYLAYRAWSHWRALAGGKHIQFLLKNQLLSRSPSDALDRIYAQASLPPPDGKTAPQQSQESAPGKSSIQDEVEVILIQKETAKQLTEALEIPEVETELERALWQVETALKAEKDRESAASKDGEEKKSR
jgi:Mitochondrial K+-H+ exchange-related